MPSYSTDIAGPLKLYIWETHKQRGEPMVFRAVPLEGEWQTAYAKFAVGQALKSAKRFNVQITNAGGEVVFKATRGTMQFPMDVERFWRECGK